MLHPEEIVSESYKHSPSELQSIYFPINCEYFRKSYRNLYSQARNRRNPLISIMGNFADKLNFMRKIYKTQKHYSAYDISTKYD